jgi:hypothetical protein
MINQKQIEWLAVNAVKCVASIVCGGVTIMWAILLCYHHPNLAPEHINDHVGVAISYFGICTAWAVLSLGIAGKEMSDEARALTVVALLHAGIMALVSTTVCAVL